jgi:NTP pyrophosphatase (non-canonical NTP hydrolase)
MNVLYLQGKCVSKLLPGCSGPAEERLRACLGVSEKAGQIARQVRSETFCHRLEPAEKAKFIEAAGGLMFWLVVLCQYSGTDLEDVVASLLQKMEQSKG